MLRAEVERGAVGVHGHRPHKRVTAVLEEEVRAGVAVVVLFAHGPLLTGRERDVPLHTAGVGDVLDGGVARLQGLAQHLAEAHLQVGGLIQLRRLRLRLPRHLQGIGLCRGVVLVSQDRTQRAFCGGAGGDVDLLPAGVRQQALGAGEALVILAGALRDLRKRLFQQPANVFGRGELGEVTGAAGDVVVHEQRLDGAAAVIRHADGNHTQVVRVAAEHLLEAELDRGSQRRDGRLVARSEHHRHVQQHALGLQSARQRDGDGLLLAGVALRAPGAVVPLGVRALLRVQVPAVVADGEHGRIDLSVGEDALHCGPAAQVEPAQVHVPQVLRAEALGEEPFTTVAAFRHGEA